MKQIALGVFFILLIPSISLGQARIPLPQGLQSWEFGPAESTVRDADPSAAIPVSFGAFVTGGQKFNIHVNFDEFEAPVDIYIGFESPPGSGDFYFLWSDGTAHPLSEGVVPWRQNTQGGIDEDIFSDISSSAIAGVPFGIYTAVAPAGDLGNFYLWTNTYNPGVIRDVVRIQDRSLIRLMDEREFVLDDLEEWEAIRGIMPPAQEPLLKEEEEAALRQPASVDLRSNQTPIKDQAGRGTCVQFALTAAIEAAYRRAYGLNLDLSEQYVNHIQKMAWLDKNLKNLDCRENQLGAWGGGNVSYQLELFRHYRIPRETNLSYISSGDFQDTAQTGDNPFINWTTPCVAGTQKMVDDFNLSDQSTTYNIPAATTLTVFPRGALENAVYGIQSVVRAPSSRLRDPGWYETQLAANREVVFGTAICGADPSPANGIWDPGTSASCGGHAMLMVGYNRTQRYFLVKNSWGCGSPAEGADGCFVRMSYDWVTNGVVHEAGYIQSVLPTSTDNTKQLFLGRWRLDHDGWQGLLDIYHLPGSFPGDIRGLTDRRLGTYYIQEGASWVGRRVNGTIDGNKIDFYIDWNSANLDYDRLQGIRFTGYIYSWDRRYMAGTLLDNRDGRTYGFYGIKGNYLSTNPGAASPSLNAYVGAWRMNHDGWLGTLNITAVNYDPIEQRSSIVGTYTQDGGSALSISGYLAPGTNFREFYIYIPFDPASPQPFHGYMHSWETGIISGTTVWAGISFGFVAARQ